MVFSRSQRMRHFMRARNIEANLHKNSWDRDFLLVSGQSCRMSRIPQIYPCKKSGHWTKTPQDLYFPHIGDSRHIWLSIRLKILFWSAVDCQFYCGLSILFCGLWILFCGLWTQYNTPLRIPSHQAFIIFPKPHLKLQHVHKMSYQYT